MNSCAQRGYDDATGQREKKLETTPGNYSFDYVG